MAKGKPDKGRGRPSGRKPVLGPAFDPNVAPPAPLTPVVLPPPPAPPRPVLGPAFTSPPPGPPPVLPGLAAAQARLAWQAGLGSSLGAPGYAPGGWFGAGPGGIGPPGVGMSPFRAAMPFATPGYAAMLGRPQAVAQPLTVHLSDDSVRALAAALGTATATAAGTPAGQRAAADGVAKAFTQAQAALSRQITIASNLGMHGTAGNASAIGRVASGLNGIGATRTGTLLSRAAMPLAVAGHVIDTVGQVMVAANDRWSTEGQIGRRLVRDLAPGGAWLQRQADAFGGRAAGMEAADTGARERAAGVQAGLGTSAFRLGFAPQQAGRSAAAAAYQGPGAYVAPPVVDRSTAAGEQRYRDEMRLLPYRRETVRLDREAVVARAEEAAIGRELVRIEARRSDLYRQRGELDRQVREHQTGFGRGSGPAYQELLRRQQTVDEELGGLTQQARAAREQQAGARARAAEARGAAEAARAREQFAAQAENRQERATRAAGLAERLGFMNPGEAAMAAAVVRFGNRFGFNALSQEQKSLFASVDPEGAQFLAREAGARNPAFRAVQQGAGGRFGQPGQSPAEIQREADALRERAAQGEFGAESRTAQAVAEASRGLGNQIAGLFKEFESQTIATIRRELRLSRNQ